MLDQHQHGSNAAPAPTSTAPTVIKCSRCGNIIPPRAPGAISSNYGLDENHQYVCFPCCANVDRAALQRGEEVSLYCHKTSAGEWVLMNWPGAIFVSKFTRITSSRHIVFNRTSTTRRDFWFKYGEWEYHGINIGDNDIVRCKARRAPAPAPKKHYIAGAGLAGYMYQCCEVFETKTSAAQFLADIHELSQRSMLKLRRDMYIDLDLAIHGNEYCEITQCECNDPSVHSDSGEVDF